MISYQGEPSGRTPGYGLRLDPVASVRQEIRSFSHSINLSPFQEASSFMIIICKCEESAQLYAGGGISTEATRRENYFSLRLTDPLILNLREIL